MNNTKNSVKPSSDIATMSVEDLSIKMSEAITSNDFANISFYAQELEKRKKWQPLIDSIDNEHNKIKEYLKNKLSKWNLENKDKKALTNYILKNIKGYKEKTTQWLEGLKQQKDKEIADLTAQLNDAVVNLPTLREYVSYKRRRLANMKRTFDEYKNEKNKSNWKYPKNVLLFCMWMTDSKVFWIRQWLKRWWAKMRRSQKNDEIAKNIKVAEKKLEDNNDDKAHVRLLKQLLRKELLEAKTTYLEQQKKKIFW